MRFKATLQLEGRTATGFRVPPEVVQLRVAAGLEAGGTLVTDEYAPRFWVLADPHGNRACITSGEGRD